MSEPVVTTVPINTLRQDEQNANAGNARGDAMITTSLRKYGAGRSVLLDRNGVLIAGNKTTKNALAAEIGEVIVVQTDGTKLVAVQRTDLDLSTDPEAREMALADNRAGEVSLTWDVEQLAIHVQDPDIHIEEFFSWDELRELDLPAHLLPPVEGAPSSAERTAEARRTLAERFGVPPFSVLDCRQGYWQKRKRAWIALGIQSELGRGSNILQGESAGFASGSGEPGALRIEGSKKANAVPSGSPRPHDRAKSKQHVDGVLMTSDSGNDPAYYYKKQEAEKRLGRALTTEEFQRDYYTGPDTYESGTSIFDPVLCELLYRWYTPEGGTVLDPFAGGSVRGIVASMLGRRYTGIDLRSEQVHANEAQADRLCRDTPRPRWLCGDSRDVTDLAPGRYEFLLSCPPYADLERYSDDPRDLSTMSYADFLAAYRAIIAAAVALLEPDSFAAFVVGEVRNKQGMQVGFVPDTINAFQAAGCSLYNEAVLVTSIGSAAIRAGRQFTAGRKLTRCHQNVLVFCKGDWRRAMQKLGSCEVGDAVASADGIDSSGDEGVGVEP